MSVDDREDALSRNADRALPLRAASFQNPAFDRPREQITFSTPYWDRRKGGVRCNGLELERFAVPNCRRSWSAGLLLLALGSLLPLNCAKAQTQPNAGTLKTEIYFGSRTADGQVVGDQAWEEFVSQVVVPRFSAGLTVLDARGRSGANAPLDRVRVLVLIYPNSPDAQARLGEIKTEYKKRFGSARVFHTDQPIRVHEAD